jgi:hypothetical protein
VEEGGESITPANPSRPSFTAAIGSIGDNYAMKYEDAAFESCRVGRMMARLTCLPLGVPVASGSDLPLVIYMSWTNNVGVSPNKARLGDRSIRNTFHDGVKAASVVSRA